MANGISNELRLQALNPTQHWSFWRPWTSPTPVWEPQEVYMPRSAWGPDSWEVDLPWSPLRLGLQEALMPQPVWGSAP